MKTYIKFIAISIFFFTVTISAQQTTWLDVDLKETNKTNSQYYKVVSKDHKTAEYFYKSGNIFRRYNYKNRKPIGVFSEFYESGELRTTGRYENGLEDGGWKTYYKNGKIKEKGDYREGEKIGVWKTFYKNF